MSKAAREWIGEETSTQLVRLKNRLGLSFPDDRPAPDAHLRADYAIKEARLAALNTSGIGQLMIARIERLKNSENADEIAQILEMMDFFLNVNARMEKMNDHAKDLFVAALLADLSCALEVDAE